MQLPELEWQILYGRLAWAVVLAAAVVALLPLAWRRRTVVLGVLAVCGALMALPHENSPAYWLVLAFQWPSAVLAGCCLWRLGAGNALPRAMPVSLSAPVALAGTVLYLDTLGWLSLGLYDAGFGPQGAPVVALAVACACVLAISRNRARPQALILLGAVAAYSIARLPTGNLWDALLDPLLWAWALASLSARGLRCMRRQPQVEANVPA
jgi:hypothetical protein